MCLTSKDKDPFITDMVSGKKRFGIGNAGEDLNLFVWEENLLVELHNLLSSILQSKNERNDWMHKEDKAHYQLILLRGESQRI